jgi:hypothetical protein
MDGLGLGNITNAFGGLMGNELEAKTDGMLCSLLGGLDLGNMTEADLGGRLGDLGLGNITDADLDGL